MRTRHRYSDELAAYVAAQWASGFTQREVAATVLGQSNSVFACILIRRFLIRYTVMPTRMTARGTERCVVYGDPRRACVKEALANFVAAREGRTDQFPRA